MLLLATLLLGCGDDADTQDDSPWDPDAAIHVDQGYRVQATVIPGTSLTGWEEYESTDPQAGQTLCRTRWEVSGTPGEACPECAWAFDVTYGDAQVEEGECTHAWARDDAITAWGWAETVDMGDYTWDDVVMLYTSGSGWYAWSYGSYADGELDAEYIQSYIYY